MLEHTDAGALGVVLSRPLDEACPPALDRWEPHLTPPATLFSGGPVDGDALIGVARLRGARHDGWHPTTVEGDGGVGSIDLALTPDDIADHVDGLRIFRGYSGWAPLQLEGELDRGAWIVLDALTDDVVTHDPAGLWRRVLRRQGGRIAWVADAPDDLSAN